MIITNADSSTRLGDRIHKLLASACSSHKQLLFILLTSITSPGKWVSPGKSMQESLQAAYECFRTKQLTSGQ
jgi:hypothetical protein